MPFEPKIIGCPVYRQFPSTMSTAIAYQRDSTSGLLCRLQLVSQRSAVTGPNLILAVRGVFCLAGDSIISASVTLNSGCSENFSNVSMRLSQKINGLLALLLVNRL